MANNNAIVGLLRERFLVRGNINVRLLRFYIYKYNGQLIVLKCEKKNDEVAR